MSDNAPGGPGFVLVVFGPPVVGTALGALVAGAGHRVIGGAIGFGVGVAAIMAFNAYTSAKTKALMNAPPVNVTALKNNGYPYTLTSTTGGDIVAQATAAGFHVDGSQPHGAGPITALWQGSDGAAVPAGISATQSAALAAQ